MSQLTVRIIEAKDLMAKDKGGTSDPFVRVKWGYAYKDGKSSKGQRKIGQTAIVKKSLNPEWKEEFKVDLDKDSKGSVQIFVDVWDKDKMSKNDFLGRAILRFDDFPDGFIVDKWWRLKSRVDESGKEKDEVDSGEIHVAVFRSSYSSPSSAVAERTESRKNLLTVSAAEKKEETMYKPVLLAEDEDKNTMGRSRSCTIENQLLENDLAKGHGEEITTAPQGRNFNIFRSLSRRLNRKSSKKSVSVLKRAESVLNMAKNKGVQTKLPRSLFEDNEDPRIRSAKALSAELIPGIFKVTLHKAELELEKECDPYVRLKYRKQRYKSAFVRKSITPTFEECFLFDVGSAKDNEKLCIELMDHDALRDDYIGEVLLDWQRFSPPGRDIKSVTQCTVPVIQSRKRGKERIQIGTLSLSVSGRMRHVNDPDEIEVLASNSIPPYGSYDAILLLFILVFVWIIMW